MKTKHRWEYPPLSDLVTIVVRDIYNTGEDTFTLLRPCQYIFDDQGRLVRKIYCTLGALGRNPRFFATKGEGWSEKLPNTNKLRRKQAGKPLAPKGGGCADCPHIGNVDCHRLVAYAWCEHPDAATKDPLWYKKGHGYECDHKNCDHANYNPQNLEWVTEQENDRRRWQVEKPLKRLGITPISRVSIPHLDCLYHFHEVQLKYFFEQLPAIMAVDPDELTIDNINNAIRRAIDDTIDHTIHCARCGCEMIEDTDEHHTHAYGTLCDCCYDELYG